MQTITGIMDFAISGGTGTPACLLNNTDVQNYMANAQMYTPTLVLQTQDPFDVVGAVSGGDCDGAVVYDVELAEAMARSAPPLFPTREQPGAVVAHARHSEMRGCRSGRVTVCPLPCRCDCHREGPTTPTLSSATSK